MVFLDCGLFNVVEWSDLDFFLCAASSSNIEDAHTEKAPGCLVSCCQAWPVKNFSGRCATHLSEGVTIEVGLAEGVRIAGNNEGGRLEE